MPPSPTTLASRTTRELLLTLAEASQMAEAGFKFAEFAPEYGHHSGPALIAILPLVAPLTRLPC